MGRAAQWTLVEMSSGYMVRSRMNVVDKCSGAGA